MKRNVVSCSLLVVFLLLPNSFLFSGKGLFIVTPDSELLAIAIGETKDFDTVHQWVANPSGVVAFVGVQGGKAGVYLYRDKQLLIVLREGQPIPGGSGKVFSRDTSSTLGFTLRVDRTGSLLVGAAVSGGLTGVFLYSSGSLSTLAVAGQTDPRGIVWRSVYPIHVLASGEAVFGGQTLTGVHAFYSYSPVRRNVSVLFSSASTYGPAGSAVGCRGAEGTLGPSFVFDSINDNGDVALLTLGERTEQNPVDRVFLYSQGLLRFIECGRTNRVVLSESGGIFLIKENQLKYFDGSKTIDLASFPINAAFRTGTVKQVLNSMIFDTYRDGSLQFPELWLATRDGVTKIADTSTTLPDPFRSKLIQPHYFLQHASNNFLLLVRTSSAGSTQDALFMLSKGNLTHIASVGLVTPGGGGFQSFGDWNLIGQWTLGSVNGVGHTAFLAGVLGGLGSPGLFYLPTISLYACSTRVRKLAGVLWRGLATYS